MCKNARVIECTIRIPAIMIWLPACLPAFLAVYPPGSWPSHAGCVVAWLASF